MAKFEGHIPVPKFYLGTVVAYKILESDVLRYDKIMRIKIEWPPDGTPMVRYSLTRSDHWFDEDDLKFEMKEL